MNKIIAENKKGNKPIALEDFTVEEEVTESKTFDDVVGQDSLTRFDKPKRRPKRRNKKRKGQTTQAKGGGKNSPKNKPKRSNRRRKPKKDD